MGHYNINIVLKETGNEDVDVIQVAHNEGPIMIMKLRFPRKPGNLTR
jgi:hypothetical protein